MSSTLALASRSRTLRLTRQLPSSALVPRQAPTVTFARSASTEAGLPPAPARKSLLRRFLTTSILLTTLFYSSSLLVAQQSDRYHDFFVESVPLGESLLDAFEESDLGDKAKKLTGQVNKAIGDVRGTVEKEKPKVEERAKDAKATAKREAEKIQSKATKAAEESKKKVEEGLNKVKKEEPKEQIKAAAEKAKQKLGAAKDDASDALKSLTSQAEAALGISSPPAASSASTSAGPRKDVDGTPQPAPSSAKAPWSGAPIPLDFEPPPGFTAPKGRALIPRDDSKSKGVALPLLAPSVRDVSQAEPVLGQLATTIDSLAFFLRDHPHIVSSEDEAKKILSTAQIDLENLGSRLASIKEAERVRLSGQLDEQAQKYNKDLKQKERDLIDRLDKQEEGWKNAFESERSQLVSGYKAKLDKELEVQQDLIEQRLKEEVIAQGIELQRRWIREIKTRVEQERGGRLGRLDALEKELRVLERVTLDNSDYLDDNIRVHRLWSAIRSVVNAAVGEGDSRQRRPFAEQFRSLKSIAARSGSSDAEDSPLDVVLSSVPSSTTSAGVDSLPFLSTWFTRKLVPRIKLAALLPENGGFFSYVASAGLSTLLFRKNEWTDGKDVMSVLGRAEWYLNEKDLDGATREINQLTGWPKVLARDWLEAARKHLEVRQALEVAETEATLESLLVL